MRLTITIVFFILITAGYSQKKGTLKVITNPRTAIIRLDTILLKSNTPIQIQSGKYMLKVWAPNKKLQEQEITVVPDSNIMILKTLTFQDDYLSYQKQLKKYKFKRFTSRFLPIPVFVGLSVFNFKRMSSVSEEVDIQYNRAVEAETVFNESVYLDDIESNRNTFNHAKEAYNKELSSLNQAKVIAYGTVAVGAIVSWYFLRYAKRLEKPNYEDKTLLSHFNFNYQENNGVNTFVLTYNF